MGVSAAVPHLILRESIPSDCEAVRVIRNECRQRMTRDTKEISQEEQQRWWLSRNPRKCLLFTLTDHEDVIGYGLLRLISGHWWISGGLKASARGKGNGKFLFRCLAKLAGHGCCLEVRADNLTALHIYRSIGFVQTSEFDSIITMVLP